VNREKEEDGQTGRDEKMERPMRPCESGEAACGGAEDEAAEDEAVEDDGARRVKGLEDETAVFMLIVGVGLLLAGLVLAGP